METVGNMCPKCGTGYATLGGSNTEVSIINEICNRCKHTTSVDKTSNRSNYKLETLKKYLLDKVEEGDWHGVSDAANDIRVLLAREGK